MPLEQFLHLTSMIKDNPLIWRAELAQAASWQLSNLSPKLKQQVGLALAQAIREQATSILIANGRDVAQAQSANHSSAFIDRLTLSPDSIQAIVVGMEQVAMLADPIGRVMLEWMRPNGLHIKQISVPLGVIGFIFESRATVLPDAVALCLKAGNAVILRGGSECLNTNKAFFAIIRRVLEQHNVPSATVQLLETGNREEVAWLCDLDGYVDVIIPRGGKGLMQAVQEHATVPVLGHLDGVCHIYVDRFADIPLAIRVIDDAKTQRAGVCNALETLLVHQDIAQEFLPSMVHRLQARGVECRADAHTMQSLSPLVAMGRIAPLTHATEEDWRQEYEDLILSIKIVPTLEDAISHINTYGSHHSDSIMTQDEDAKEKFLRSVDSACVYSNCSTRFSDGCEFGFGGEIGISTGKLHARGPVGVAQLTSYKYIISGDGHVKDPTRFPENTISKGT